MKEVDPHDAIEFIFNGERPTNLVGYVKKVVDTVSKSGLH